MLVHELIFRGKNDTLAIIEGQQQITYQQLQEKTAAYRDFFYALGIRCGDNVALCSRNCQEYIFAYMAINWLGAVAVPINFQLSPREIVYILKDAGIEFFITHKELDFTTTSKDPLAATLNKSRPSQMASQQTRQCAGATCAAVYNRNRGYRRGLRPATDRLGRCEYSELSAIHRAYG